MNIFVLDTDIRACARYHADRHVVKMILEGAQMLCTVLHQAGQPAPYRPTHTQHPCTRWAGESLTNWQWLKRLTLCLNDEYLYRYRKTDWHQSALVVRDLSPPPLPAKGLTPFAQAMPEQYRVSEDAVQAYRNFYVHVKAPIATWTRRRPPRWFISARSAIKPEATEKP